MTALLYLIIALENIVGLFCMGCLLYDIKIGLVEPTPKTCLTYFLKLAMATTATTLLYTKLWSILYSSITARLALEVMGSFVATCVLRHRQASDCFLVIVSRELRGIFNDFSAAPMTCVKAHRLGWRSLICILYKSASGLPRYALYGPVLGGFRLVEKFFLVPLHLIQKVLHMSSLWCENTSRLPKAVSGLPLTWGGGAIWIGIVAVTSFLSFMLITHLSGTLTHRFFAHRCFCTSRGFTWVLYAFCSLQTPPIWWSSIHRRHHRQTDSDTDPHPPGEKGFLYAYLGWLTDRENFGTNLSELRDMTNSYPELLLLELLPIGIENMVRRFCVLPLWTATARFVLRMQWGEAPDNIIKFHERFVVQAAYLGAIFAVHVSLFFNAYAHQSSDVESKVSPGDTVCDININSELTKKQLEETKVRQSGGNVNNMKPQECMEDKKKDWKEEVHPTNKRPYAAKDLHIKWFDYISSGESYHARHHKWPRLAQNSPYSREDWVFLFINCMERMGLVWKVVRPNEKMKME